MTSNQNRTSTTSSNSLTKAPHTTNASLTHLLPPTYKRLVASWLEEDCPTFDNGGYVVGESLGTAYLWCKSPGVVAGVPFFNEVFRQLGCGVTWHVNEGDYIDPSKPQSQSSSSSSSSSQRTHVATIQGPTNALLLGERTALNILARASGIATESAKLLSLVRSAGYQGILAGTRKTTPGFRLVEKYAMLVGGADTHRLDLSGMVMLKDNHVVAARRLEKEEEEKNENKGTETKKSEINGSGVGDAEQPKGPKRSDGGGIKAAVTRARRVAGFSTKIEVEVQDEAEAEEAIEAGADVIMLDNFPLSPSTSATSTSSSHPPPSSSADAEQSSTQGYDGTVGAVSQRLKTKYRGQNKFFLIEVSGGITEKNVGAYLKGCAATTTASAAANAEGGEEGGGGGGGIDIVSTSAIHQGVKHVDFSMKIV